jgi:hypothetical protein
VSLTAKSKGNAGSEGRPDMFRKKDPSFLSTDLISFPTSSNQAK